MILHILFYMIILIFSSFCLFLAFKMKTKNTNPTIFSIVTSTSNSKLLCFTLSSIMVFLFFWRSYSNSNVYHYHYGIIFDAGSTGSRMHVFKFLLKQPLNQWSFMEELFVPIKPGLSSFADSPFEGAKTLVVLLDKAKEFIPSNTWSKTPIILQATAGLRLLSEKSASDLLDSVKSLFKQYPFKYMETNVKIMDDVDEGLYSWATLNYLKKTYKNLEETVGTIDLGGGSVQVTFIPVKKKTLSTLLHDSLNKMNLLNLEMEAYTKSYLGLGLMMARMQSLSKNEKTNGNILISPCLPDNYNGTMKFQGEDYNIAAAPILLNRFSDCQHIIKQEILNSKNIFVTEEFFDEEFFAISYFYDRALQAGLIFPDSTNKENSASVDDFEKSAKHFCENVNMNPRKPFFCFDLSYISTLFQYGFKFPKSYVIKLVKQIDNTEISWALGAMLETLPRN